jgi:hypothetical protein
MSIFGQTPDGMLSPMNFPASTIADALGCSAQAVRQRLAGVAPAGVVAVAGNEADAWNYAAVPDALRAEL